MAEDGYGLFVASGLSGSRGGNAGKVTVLQQSGLIETKGNYSTGVLAASKGGKGGAGGSATAYQ
jgi:hypothetical protein